MDNHPGETSHVIFLGEFERRKNYKEKILKEIIVAVCAMLNSNGGKVTIDFDTDSSIPVEGFSFSQVSLVIRILEQSIISIIGLHQTITKVNFRHDGNSVIIFVKKADSLVTSYSNLYLPSTKQVVQVSSQELPKVYNGLINRKNVLQPLQADSHCDMFPMDKLCHFQECKTVQFKNPKAGSSKRTTLADRIAGKSNKFSCYVSAYANYSGGHVYYGITDDGVVEGEFIPNDKGEIIKKVEKAINKMIWPEQIGKPKRGEQWDIFFEPVLDENSKSIPSTFVVVIYIAPCLGGVFNEEPECYEMVNGMVSNMSFSTWKKRISLPENLNDHSSCSDKVPCAVSRIEWSSNEIKEKCAVAGVVLMELINHGNWTEFKRKASIIQNKYPENRELLLVVLSKMVIAYSRQGKFRNARTALSHFCEICTKVVDSPFFNALALYLQIVLKRNQKEFCGIDELLGNALANAELIEVGCLTAAIHLIVATVTSFKEEESGSDQDKLCNTAIEHLAHVVKPSSVSSDMMQKAYITLVLSNLKCVLSKDIILAENCTESDLKKAKSALIAFNETTLESPPNPFRKIQTKLAKSVLYYRQAQIKDGVGSESNVLWKSALNFAKEAETLAKKLNFDEMDRWSKQLISVCTAGLVLNHNMPNEELELFAV